MQLPIGEEAPTASNGEIHRGKPVLNQLPALYAFTRFFKRDLMKFNYVSEMTTNSFEVRTAKNLFAEMKNNLPALSVAFRTGNSYKLDLDMIYHIIQPQMESNFLTPEEHKTMVDSIFIMIENGISFAPSTSTVFIKNSKGNSRRALYEPAFEKYLIYADELPRVVISDIALRHMLNNYQYMTHVYDAQIPDFVGLCVMCSNSICREAKIENILELPPTPLMKRMDIRNTMHMRWGICTVL